MDSAELPIGVFDSGMGGLTVLSALRRVLPDERFIYLGDTARLPYGTKSADTVVRYAQQAADQLVARGVKALVVACNTASAFALQHLREHFDPLPVFGVVEPGAQAAAAVADASGVVVFATESTIEGGAYQRALTRLAPQVPVFGRACPLWVTLAEQGPSAESVVSPLLHHYLRGLVSSPSKTILLGCTHFPVFAASIASMVGPEVRVVDSAQTTAAIVAQTLGKLDTSPQATPSPSLGLSFLATDGVARFKKVGSYFLGEPIGHVERVDL